MQNYISSGASIDVVLPNTAKAGIPYVHGTLVGIPTVDGDGTTLCALQLRGVYKLPKATGTMSAGAKVYWKADDGNLVTTATGNTLVGAVTKAALSADTTVEVVLSNGV